MEGLLEAIEDYWTNRAEGYSQVNLEELAGPQWPVWRHPFYFLSFLQCNRSGCM